MPSRSTCRPELLGPELLDPDLLGAEPPGAVLLDAVRGPLRIAFALLVSGMSLAAQDRPAAKILSEFDRLCIPTNSRGAPDLLFERNVALVARRKGELALELYKQHPEHARVAELMRDRWMLMLISLRQPARVLAETSAQAKGEGLRKDVRREALLACARATLAAGKEPRVCAAAIDAFLAVDGQAVAAGFLILDLLHTRNIPTLMAKQLLAKVEKRWPAEAGLQSLVKVYRTELQRIGQAIGGQARPLEFDDMLTGKRLSTADGASDRTLCVYWWHKPPADAAQITAAAAKQESLRVLGMVNFAAPVRRQAAREALRRSGVRWPHCFREGKTKRPWLGPATTPGQPFFYLLDKQGKVLRFAYTWSVMAAILAEK